METGPLGEDFICPQHCVVVVCLFLTLLLRFYLFTYLLSYLFNDTRKFTFLLWFRDSTCLVTVALVVGVDLAGGFEGAEASICLTRSHAVSVCTGTAFHTLCPPCQTLVFFVIICRVLTSLHFSSACFPLKPEGLHSLLVWAESVS